VSLTEHAESILEFAGALVLAPAPDANAVEPTDDPSLVKTQALRAVSYLLATLPSPLPLSESALAILTNKELWELVKPEEPAALRRALYEVLGAAAERKEEDLLSADGGVKIIAGKVLRYCWGEDEGWAGVIAFLRRELCGFGQPRQRTGR
jgi:hypothetical protein